MTYGADGEKLVKQIYNLSNAPEIIVYCGNVDYHK